jgi:DNA-binding response OmpR family regulator
VLATGAKCPCCGQPGPVSAEVFVSDVWRTVWCNGEKVRLTPLQFDVFRVVMQAAEGIMCDRLAEIVYRHAANGGPEDTRTTIFVIVNRLNKLLQPLKLAVRRTVPRSWYAPYHLVHL